MKSAIARSGKAWAVCRALFIGSLASTALLGPLNATAGLPAPMDTPVVPKVSAALPPVEVERSLNLKKGDTLAGALKSAGFSPEQITALTRANAAAGKPVTAKTQLTFTYEEKAPYQIESASLAYRPNPTSELKLALKGLQARADVEAKPLKDVQAVAVGRIRDSLYEDATEAGLPANLVSSFMNIFAWDIDYTRDIHPGDTFKVTFEETQNDQGQRVKTGRILAAEFRVGKETRTAYWFNGEYLNEKGESKKKLLLRTPLEFTRISSTFGMRQHPVLGFSRMHKGTDFAAGYGTPVKASGDGTVIFKGAHGGHGNYVQIKHNSGFTTGYAHLARFANGMRQGSKVKQGQVIAYVGSTGISTGPHLHYEVIRNGEYVDAMSTKLPTGTPLSKSQLAQFKNMVGSVQTAWNRAMGTMVASR